MMHLQSAMAMRLEQYKRLVTHSLCIIDALEVNITYFSNQVYVVGYWHYVLYVSTALLCFY